MNSLPPTMLAWPLFGAGLERLGRHGRPCRIPVPAIRPGELLDAVVDETEKRNAATVKTAS